ncbi:hypothetical protein BC938DRAFT_471389 [Jimgerdemannia flammicorona]|uniref:Uncharacterized protein n=1 Tax=Jimgerdemannia flammicorona TaxID=994334 RepID=A0A433Q881_9FUNG|nr:hypothetical protein BC938DRAFT_471389 [Jimgerdemannia flammicorona]
MDIKKVEVSIEDVNSKIEKVEMKVEAVEDEIKEVKIKVKKIEVQIEKIEVQIANTSDDKELEQLRKELEQLCNKEKIHLECLQRLEQEQQGDLSLLKILLKSSLRHQHQAQAQFIDCNLLMLMC